MSKNRHIIVVEARPESLRLFFLRATSDGYECADTQSFAPNQTNSDTSTLHDQLLLDAAAERIRERSEWSRAGLICLVGGGDVECNYFKMPGLEGRALNDAVRLKLSQQLHFPIDDAVTHLCMPAKGTSSDSALVCATAMPRQTAEAAVAFAQQVRRPLTLVTTAGAAAIKLAESLPPIDGEPVRAVLQVEQSYSTLIVTVHGAPLLSAELPVGLNDFTRALLRPIISGDDVHQLETAQAIDLRDRVGIPDRDADIGLHNLKGKSLLPLLEPALQRIAQQLTQWLTHAATADGGGTVSRLTLVGIGASMPGLDTALKGRLKIGVDRADWRRELGRLTTSRSEDDVESFVLACAAAKYCTTFPDLLPVSERRRRRIARFRSATTKAGPIIAAATLGIAFLFNQVGGRLSQAVGDVQAEMTRVQTVVDQNVRLQEERRAVGALTAELDAFASATPNWLGFFKELSRILPPEIRATRLSTRQAEGALHVVIEGDVLLSRRGHSFDQIVEQTLTGLERSPFASAVNIVNSTRGEQNGAVSGTLVVEVSLAYVTPVFEKAK